MLRKQSSKPLADDEIAGEDPKEEELTIEDKLEISSSRELEKELSKGKILDCLSSDAQKLTDLQISLQDIRKKAEMKKKGTSKNVKLEGLKIQLQDLQETVVQLLIINDHLRRDMESGHHHLHRPSSITEEEDIERVRERKVREQAKRESEKIGRLQFEVQDIQYVLLKMEDENKMKKNKTTTTTTTTTTTGFMLRDIIKGSRKCEEAKERLFLRVFQVTNQWIYYDSSRS